MDAESDPPGLPATRAGSLAPPRGARAEYLFLLLASVYLSRALVLRWLYPYLFFKVTAKDLVMATGPELAYMAFSSCLAVAGWVLVLYLALDLVPRISRRLLVPLALLLVLLVAYVEMDMSWFGLSHRHVALQQILTGFKEIGSGQWGVTRADLDRYALQIAKQAVVIGALAAVARLGERLPWRPSLRLRPGLAVLLFIPVFAIDSAVVGHRLAHGNKQWALLVAANGFRPTFADRLWERYFRSRAANYSDIEEANKALQHPGPVSRAPAEGTRARAAAVGKPLDVLLVVAESFNVYKVDSTSMPALSSLKRSSYDFLNHYSTGNFSEAGELGILYGAPSTFYRGDGPSDSAGSRYVDLFNQHGYRTTAIGHNLKYWRFIETYLLNLGDPVLEIENDWAVIPALRAAWQKAGPHFVSLFYYGTHFPFEHDARFDAFQPQTPAGFDYFSPHLREHENEIVNRYRNALLELDSWLEAALKVIDLDNTIVIVTGDHGEEIFENGILGHASNLDAPQIRTPLVIRVPGRGHREIRHVTSHMDVLPTIVDLLGWEQPAGAMGRPLLDDGPAGRAIAADTNFPGPSYRWAVITGDRKSIVESDGDGSLRIVSLTDTSEHPAFFKDEPARWEENFGQIRVLQEAISATTRRTNAAAVPQPATR